MMIQSTEGQGTEVYEIPHGGSASMEKEEACLNQQS